MSLRPYGRNELADSAQCYAHTERLSSAGSFLSCRLGYEVPGLFPHSYQLTGLPPFHNTQIAICLCAAASRARWTLNAHMASLTPSFDPGTARGSLVEAQGELERRKCKALSL